MTDGEVEAEEQMKVIKGKEGNELYLDVEEIELPINAYEDWACLQDVAHEDYINRGTNRKRLVVK